MKKRISLIIAFVLGGILFSSIAVYATIAIQASDIKYNGKQLDVVLDDLYSKANSMASTENYPVITARIADLSSKGSYTFESDYQGILIVTSYVTATTYRPTYNGVTYNWNVGNHHSASVILIPNITAGTTITFESNISCTIFAYEV